MNLATINVFIFDCLRTFCGKNVGTTPLLADLALIFAPQVSDISTSRAEGA